MTNNVDDRSVEHGIEDHGEKKLSAPEAGLLGRLINQGGIVFAIGIVVSMLILAQEVFLRYVLNAPTIWAHETTIFLCAIAFIYGGLYCAARNSHIRVVILYDIVPRPVRRVLDVVISLSCAFSACFFAWASWLMVQKALFTPDGAVRLETSGSAWNPPIPALLKTFLFVTMLLLAIQFLVLAFNYARGKAGVLPSTPGEGDA
ncbi:MAG: TRAP transporter small permease [Rhodobacteraceae bacterium]|nr:TRAP transporter small permease [Paracoccaceae bacterium]